ncbi:MAG TPA: two-component regulator propeller domain-containing protein, partial [Chitinophagaceae bacterium]|nr:two-component regulator propeller domain-containing protein [Chitinophagaceae bacterium]
MIIFNCSITNAQITKNVPYRVIDESNRLSDNNVTCIYKDNTGFLWIGTASGLDLLDGSTITVFKNSPADTNSISNNYIQWVTQDSSGFFWVGTKNGLNKFDFQQRKFSTVAVLGYGKVNNDGI